MTAALRVTAVLQETAALGMPGRADYRQDTYDHIPGSVLRGALAAAWLRTPGTPGPDDRAFREVFEGDGTFGPLHSTASLPVPLSVWTHNGAPWPGCRMSWDEVYTEVPHRCPTCKDRLVQSKGLPAGRPDLRSRTRVAVDEDGIAADGRLFRRAALAAGTALTGWVSGPAVHAFAPAGRPVTTVRLGGERSVRGRAELTTDDTAPPLPEHDGAIVVLRLAAPGVFVDRFGHPADRPGKPELAEVLGVKIRDVHAGPQDRWVRWTEVGGWHMASGLPKPRDRAVAPGSTYRVTCVAPPAPDRLAALAAQGVGLRRREGCGGLYVPAAPMSPAATTGTPLHAVVAVTGWPKWAKLGPYLRRGAAPPSVLRDPSLSADQRAALQTLLDVADPAELHRLLDALGVPQ